MKKSEELQNILNEKYNLNIIFEYRDYDKFSVQENQSSIVHNIMLFDNLNFNIELANKSCSGITILNILKPFTELESTYEYLESFIIFSSQSDGQVVINSFSNYQDLGLRNYYKELYKKELELSLDEIKSSDDLKEFITGDLTSDEKKVVYRLVDKNGDGFVKNRIIKPSYWNMDDPSEELIKLSKDHNYLFGFNSLEELFDNFFYLSKRLFLDKELILQRIVFNKKVESNRQCVFI